MLLTPFFPQSPLFRYSDLGFLSVFTKTARLHAPIIRHSQKALDFGTSTHETHLGFFTVSTETDRLPVPIMILSSKAPSFGTPTQSIPSWFRHYFYRESPGFGSLEA